MNKMLIILSGKEFPMQSSDDTRAVETNDVANAVWYANRR